MHVYDAFPDAAWEDETYDDRGKGAAGSAEPSFLLIANECLIGFDKNLICKLSATVPVQIAMIRGPGSGASKPRSQ